MYEEVSLGAPRAGLARGAFDFLWVTAVNSRSGILSSMRGVNIGVVKNARATRQHSDFDVMDRAHGERSHRIAVGQNHGSESEAKRNSFTYPRRRKNFPATTSTTVTQATVIELHTITGGFQRKRCARNIAPTFMEAAMIDMIHSERRRRYSQNRSKIRAAIPGVESMPQRIDPGISCIVPVVLSV